MKHYTRSNIGNNANSGLDMIRLFIIRISLKTSPFKSKKTYTSYVARIFGYKKTILFVFYYLYHINTIFNI